MYSVTSQKSFVLVEKLRTKILSLKNDIKLPFLLIGNKTDAIFGKEVTRTEGENLAKNLGCNFAELSVYNYDELAECLKNLIDRIKAVNTVELNGLNNF